MERLYLKLSKIMKTLTRLTNKWNYLGLPFAIALLNRYNIGLRLVEEYLAKTHTRGIKSFRSSCQNLAAIAFPMYTGVSASIDNWNEDEQSCRISMISFIYLI